MVLFKLKIMIEKFRRHYKERLTVKIITVIIVVLLSVFIILPILKIAEVFGINIRGNGGFNFKVALPNIFFFFLFGIASTSIIWLAQKYIHKAKLLDLGFRTKVFKYLLIGFVFGVLKNGLPYLIMMSSASNVEYISVIPNDVSIWAYIGYYLYFIFGFIIWNSFIEELGTRAYPIEKLRKYMNPHLIFTIMGVIFTIGHLAINKFSIGYCIALFISSYLFSLVYHYSNSIWLVIGIHSGMNWVTFSFFGTNWKLGTLIHLEIYGTPDWINSYIQSIIGILALLLVVFIHKKGFFKKFSS